MHRMVPWKAVQWQSQRRINAAVNFSHLLPTPKKSKLGWPLFGGLCHHDCFAWSKGPQGKLLDLSVLHKRFSFIYKQFERMFMNGHIFQFLLAVVSLVNSCVWVFWTLETLVQASSNLRSTCSAAAVLIMKKSKQTSRLTLSGSDLIWDFSQQDSEPCGGQQSTNMWIGFSMHSFIFFPCASNLWPRVCSAAMVSPLLLVALTALQCGAGQYHQWTVLHGGSSYEYVRGIKAGRRWVLFWHQRLAETCPLHVRVFVPSRLERNMWYTHGSIILRSFVQCLWSLCGGLCHLSCWIQIVNPSLIVKAAARA